MFRWERAELIPRANRGERGERLYGEEHLRAISDHKAGTRIRERYESAARFGDKDALQEASEASSLNKVIAGDVIGLRELEEYRSISERTVRQLLRIANNENLPKDFLTAPKLSDFFDCCSVFGQRGENQSGFGVTAGQKWFECGQRSERTTLGGTCCRSRRRSAEVVRHLSFSTSVLIPVDDQSLMVKKVVRRDEVKRHRHGFRVSGVLLIEAADNPRPVDKLCHQTQHPKQDHHLGSPRA